MARHTQTRAPIPRPTAEEIERQAASMMLTRIGVALKLLLDLPSFPRGPLDGRKLGAMFTTTHAEAERLRDKAPHLREPLRLAVNVLLDFADTGADLPPLDPTSRDALNHLQRPSVQREIRMALDALPEKVTAATDRPEAAVLAPTARKLRPSRILAGQSYEYVTQEAPHLTTEKERWSWLRENGCPQYGDRREPGAASLPASRTWARYVRAYLHDPARPKVTPRAGRPYSKSIAHSSDL